MENCCATLCAWVFIAGPAGEAVLPGTIKIGAALLWIAAILTLYTGFDYLQAAVVHFGEDDTR